MKKMLFWLGVVILLFIIGCSSETLLEQQRVAEPAPEPIAEAPLEEPAPEVQTAPVNLSCTLTADCEAGKQCLNGQCGTIEQLYQTDCISKCNFEEIIISTSDGETYTLGKGQGSYTAAGALEWKLISVPNYCPMEKVIVPIRIIAKNYGKIVGEYALTLEEGETSDQIMHPDIPSIEFTVTLDDVKEKCG